MLNLYIYIPHKNGIKLNKRQVLQPHEDRSSSRTHILNKKKFVFEGEHYLQIQGAAMGTRMTPSHASVFTVTWRGRYSTKWKENLTSGGGMLMMCSVHGHMAKNALLNLEIK